MKRLYHAVFALKAHLVIVTKYRRKLLTEALLEESRILFERLVMQWGCELLEFGGEQEHVYLLLTLRPDI